MDGKVAPEKRRPVFIIVHESWLANVVSDIATGCIMLSLIGIGIWLDSVVLQVVGAIMSMFAIATKAVGETKWKRVCYSADEARQAIDDVEAGKFK